MMMTSFWDSLVLVFGLIIGVGSLISVRSMSQFRYLESP